MTKESDIVFEIGVFWVLKDRNSYTVMKNNGTHSFSDSAYEKSEDGLSIAICRAEYLHKRQNYYE